MVLDLVDYRAIRDDPNYDLKDHKVAGIMSQSVYWRDMIKNILPHGSDAPLIVPIAQCRSNSHF